MSSIHRAGEELRARARANSGPPHFVHLKGWAFALSYGESQLPAREEFEALRPELFARIGVPAAANLTYEQFSTTWHARNEQRKAAGILDTTWTFSAQLRPHGRSSTEKDWHVLGQMVAAVGAPLESCLTPPEKTHPNAVHYWMWRDV